MPNPIVHHLVWTAYGWWLPNDPRGSMSQCIGKDILAELGTLHFGRKRIQPASAEIRKFYDQALKKLEFLPLTFEPVHFPVIAEALADVIETERYTCYACAIMPDHVHLLIRKHKHSAEQMMQNLQRVSHLKLRDAGIRDLVHPVWGGHGWKVFLDSPSDIRRTIGYVEGNPRKGRLSDQCWAFVKPYDGWPLHEGHSPNSPYAKRLREND